VFHLSAPHDTLRIVSDSAAPDELGLARDPRLLGVALRRIVLRQGTRFVTIEVDDARLTEGFHMFEPDSRTRWTDGDAALPDAVFAGFTEGCELVLHLAGTAQYPSWGGAAQRVA
jgi:hypothetical protein